MHTYTTFIHTYTRTYTYIHIHIRIHIYLITFMGNLANTYTWVRNAFFFLGIYVYVYVCICMYAITYIHISINTIKYVYTQSVTIQKLHEKIPNNLLRTWLLLKYYWVDESISDWDLGATSWESNWEMLDTCWCILDINTGYILDYTRHRYAMIYTVDINTI